MAKTISILVITIFLSATFVYADMVIEGNGNITVNGDINVSGNLTGTNVQKPLIGSCSAGSSIRAINIDGSITCEDDTDTDAIGGLTCTIEQVAKWGGSAWVCGDPGAPSSEPQTRLNADTQLQSNIDAEQTARVAEDTNLQNQITSLNNQSCTGGTYVTGLDGSGNIICSDSGTGGIGADCPNNLVPNADLHNCNLRSAALQNLDLRGANLEGAILTKVDLSWTDLNNANLDFANLILANLEGVMFAQTTLRFTDLRNAINIAAGSASDLSHADLRNAAIDGIWGSNLSYADLRDATINGQIQDSNLSYAKLTGIKTLDGGGVSFSNTDMHNADFHNFNSTTQPLWFSNCNLSDADFSNANFHQVYFNDWYQREGNLNYANFSNAIFSVYSSFGFKNMQYANFSNAHFDGVEFLEEDSNMNYTNFSNAIFQGNTRFTIQNISYANFSNAQFIHTWYEIEMYGLNLSYSNFSQAILQYVHFDNSDLSSANFTGADLSHATLLNSNLQGATLTDVIWNDTTCPDSTNSDANGSTCEGHL